MGEVKKRKASGLGFGKVDNNALLISQSQLYKKNTVLRPDLGMALALLDYSQSLKIGCSSPAQMRDTEWDISISGVVESYARVENNLLPSLPLVSKGYFFTIAWNNSDLISKTDLVARLCNYDLVVRIEPKYKYLTRNKKEWVLPLVAAN